MAERRLRGLQRGQPAGVVTGERRRRRHRRAARRLNNAACAAPRSRPASDPLIGPPQILDEEGDPGSAGIREYDGPLVLEFRAKLPGRRVDNAGYCRPRGPPPPADALRQELWRQREQGQYCDGPVL